MKTSFPGIFFPALYKKEVLLKRLRLGVLASGGGSNLQSIIDRSLDGSLLGDVVVVISNKSNAHALDRARKHDIEALHISAITENSQEAADNRITEELLSRNIDLVVLAGYLKKVGDRLIQAFRGNIINIHPALLPKYGGQDMYGMRVHRAVIDAGEKESGPTVHIVDEHYDTGKILAQAKVPVYTDDTPESLQKRVIEKEHELLPQTINILAKKWET